MWWEDLLTQHVGMIFCMVGLANEERKKKTASEFKTETTPPIQWL